MTDPSPPKPASGTEAAREIVACAERTLAAVSARAAAASAQDLPAPQVGNFKDLRALPVTVWIDGQHIRRIHFEHGTMPKHASTLDLWEFGVPIDDLDWSRLPAFRPDRQGEQPRPGTSGGLDPAERGPS